MENFSFCAVFFYQKLPRFSWNTSVKEFISTVILGYVAGNLPVKFFLPNRQNLSNKNK